jgi:creatinine amidohydrolase
MGILLEELAWPEAEKVLGPDTVVAIPLGAAAKEHGPHLKLKNDWSIAEYLKRRVLEVADVVVAPTLAYSFYPAFVEYPGSTTLRLETARDTVVDICRGLSRFGPRRFYVINTGVSTLRALRPAAEELARDGVLLRFTDIRAALAPAEKELARQPYGGHADEVETSMMMVIDPGSVELSKAVRDVGPRAEGGFTRDPGGKGIYSPSGSWGDPTLATREKGERFVEALVRAVLDQLHEIARAPLSAR